MLGRPISHETGKEEMSPKSVDRDEMVQIVKRLDAIINVLLETSKIEGKPLPAVARIRLLYTAGLRPIEISRILGKPLANVTAQIAMMRKTRSRH